MSIDRWCPHRLFPCWNLIHSIYSVGRKLGLTKEFRSKKKFHRKDSEQFLYSAEESAHSEAFRGPRKIQFRSSERNGSMLKKLVLRNSQYNLTKWSRQMFRNGIPRVCFYFSSKERNSELFFLPRNGSERNSESLLQFLLHGTKFRLIFSSAERFGMEFQEFASIFVSLYRIPSIFLLHGMVRNGNPRIICSGEQPESPSFPSSVE